MKADTLEELVAKIYPDDTAAQQTALDSIQRYNELAKAGYDEDFHKPASRMWAVENGPFYADKFTTALLLVCIGGLESDEDCHTFDADRNVIPGLYVAGNIQANRFATEYPIGLKASATPWPCTTLRRRQERPEGHLSLKSQNNFQSPEQKMPAPAFYVTCSRKNAGIWGILSLSDEKTLFMEGNDMAVITITKENFEAEVLKSAQPVLLDFWAAWCGPCRMLSPIVDEVAEERTDVKVGKVNVDEQPDLPPSSAS